MTNEREDPCNSCNYQYEVDDLCSMCGCKGVKYEHTSDNKVGVSEISYNVWVVDDILFWASEVEKAEYIGSEWFEVKNITVGKPHSTPDVFYVVTKNLEPYLLVTVYYDYTVYTPAHTLWHNYLIIKRFEDFYYIDLLTIETIRFPANEDIVYGFVQKFYQLANCLLITSLGQIYRFDERLELIWVSGVIAWDCVYIRSFQNGYLIACGDDDPPGGWVECKVNFATGEVSDRKWDVSDYYAGLAKTLEEDPQYIIDQLFGTTGKKGKRKKK